LDKSSQNWFKRGFETSSNQDLNSIPLQLNLHLITLFPLKQKKIVLKKYQGQPLTKTEQEYFSRKIKKKLEAISSSGLGKIARKLSQK
jgi:hypothetical protein